MSPELVTALVGGAGAGGLITAGTAAWRASRTVPAERDSIIVQGAETTVQGALKLAQAEAARADREAARADRAEAKVESLLAQLEQAQTLINHIRAELIELKANNNTH